MFIQGRTSSMCSAPATKRRESTRDSLRNMRPFRNIAGYLASLAVMCAPLDAAWFRGNTHAHTNLSDGQNSPIDVARWYQQHGYQFLFITDHNGVTDVSGLNTILGNGGKFLVLTGEEITSDFGQWHVHV